MEPRKADINETFRRNLKAARKRMQISQEQLALEAGVDRTYVSQIERGLGNPTLEVVSRFAKALDVTVVELLVLS
jgi:transcriptional regulator with XRE-family HTH domain